MAVAILLVSLIGFGPRFYFLPFTGAVPERPLSWTVLLHITLFSSWVLLLIGQTALVATRRTKLHMNVGRVALVLAPAMVLSAVWLVMGLIAADPAMPTGGRASFLISLVDLIAFGGLVWLGMSNRRDPAAHKRFMLLATISLLGATAVGRMPLPDLGLGLGGYSNALIISELLLLPLVLWDLASRRSVHPATIAGSLAILASHAVQIVCIQWSVWRAFADQVGIALSA
jgi:hypothetical protein